MYEIFAEGVICLAITSLVFAWLNHKLNGDRQKWSVKSFGMASACFAVIFSTFVFLVKTPNNGAHLVYIEPTTGDIVGDAGALEIDHNGYFRNRELAVGNCPIPRGEFKCGPYAKKLPNGWVEYTAMVEMRCSHEDFAGLTKLIGQQLDPRQEVKQEVKRAIDNCPSPTEQALADVVNGRVEQYGLQIAIKEMRIK